MTEPWIRVHANLASKPVVIRAVEALGVSRHEAVGLLVQFWGAVSQHVTDGFVGPHSDTQLEVWAGWTKKKGRFAAFLRAAHLDCDGRVNEWEDYAGQLEEQRRQARDRKRKSRGSHSDVRERPHLRDETIRDDINSTTLHDAESDERQRAQHNADAAIADLSALLAGVPGAPEALTGFMEGLPSATKRMTWARSLATSLAPITGGKPISPAALVSAMADFNLAVRSDYPYTGAGFRSFAERAQREIESAATPRSSPVPRSAGNRMTDPTLAALEEWKRETDAKEAASA